jgi:phage tail sheath gpL-like
MSLPNTAVARVLGIDVVFENFNLGQALFLPMRIVLIGQGNTAAVYDLNKTTILSSGQAGTKYGFGSPLHLATRQLLPDNNDGIQGIPLTIIPLEDDGSGVEADGEITVIGTTEDVQSVGIIKIGGIASAQFVSVVGETPTTLAVKIQTAIDAVLNMPATTAAPTIGVLPLTSKWKGESANDILIEIEFDSESALSISSTAFASGAVNPDVDDALAKIIDVWESFILNCMNYDDTVTLAKYATFGEGRWNQLIKKPCVVAVGCVDDFATRTAITDARKPDRINFLVQSTGSKELPFVIAARGLAKDIVPTANDKPAKNYEGLLTGITAGIDADQEEYNTRNLAVLAGASTNILVGDVAELSDIITMYHPDGEAKPAYRKVADIVKLMNVLFNVQIILETLKSNPLAPDTTITLDPDAVQPKDVLTLFGTLADNLSGGKSMIIVEPEFTKANAAAEINATNSDRLDSVFPVKISGNVEVNSNDVKWGFFFGS